MEADIWPLKYIIHQHMIDSVVLESLGGRWDFFLNNSSVVLSFNTQSVR